VKKYGFCIIILIIYILFLTKDSLLGLSNTSNLDKFLESSKASFYEKEYKDLAKTLKIDYSKYNIIYSKVITRDIYEFFDKITIMKGTKDNLKKGDLVVNELGLVGVIKDVKNNYSEVSLLTNNNINLSVKINNSYGIVSAKDNKIYVKNLKLKENIKKGDKVYTSGLTDTPGGILIGEIVDIKTDNLDLEYIGEIKAVTNFYDLKYVGVIKS